MVIPGDSPSHLASLSSHGFHDCRTAPVPLLRIHGSVVSPGRFLTTPHLCNVMYYDWPTFPQRFFALTITTLICSKYFR
jgi:hypothetical protein